MVQPVATAEVLEPFFFRREERALFGCFHPAAAERPDLPAVLICAPVGYEGIRAHRACRQLAAQLAAAGSPTLRFDYFATGDSAGDDAEGSLAQWRDDVEAALAELRRRAGARPVAMVGLRLGACLAAQVGAGREGVDRFVLWHPLSTGKACLEQWTAVQREFNLAMGYADETSPAGWTTEVQGFPLTAPLVEELTGWEFGSVRWSGRERVLLLATANDAEADRVAAGLRAANVTPQMDPGAGPRFWDQEPLDTVVPFQTLRAIVEWLTEAKR